MSQSFATAASKPTQDIENLLAEAMKLVGNDAVAAYKKAFASC